MEPRIQYTQTSDGVSIAYATLSEGPPVIFPTRVWGDIHLYSAVPEWRPYFPALVDRGWRVIFYDGRGMGSSQREASEIGLEGRMLDLEAVIEAVGLERFALCGNQSGGPAAIVYAAGHSERVSHLILINTFAHGADYFESIPSLRVAADLSHIAEDQWEFYSLAVANGLTAFSDAEFARRLAAAIRAGTSPKVFVAEREALGRVDITDTLSSLVVPTLVIHDRADRAGDFSSLASKLASRIPGARFLATGDAPRAIDEFLREGEVSQAATRADAPSGTAIILFADIADSTALTHRLGDAKAQELVRAHNAIVRQALTACGGSEVKHTGDGIMASFPTASGALECAVAVQRGVAASADANLQVHIGLNAGEPVAEESDLFGTSVQLARRTATTRRRDRSWRRTWCANSRPAKASCSPTSAMCCRRDSKTRCGSTRCAGGKKPKMIELSDEIRSRLAAALADRCPVVAASIELDGYPKLSFYGSCQVFSADQLALWHRSPDTGLITRLGTNGRMAFLYRHPTDRVSWQFFGRARVVTDPEVRDRIYEGMPEIEKMLDKERKGQAVVVDLDRVTGAGLDMRRQDL